jgi:hypothetical protein
MLQSIKNGYALLARIMEHNPGTSLADLARRGADHHRGSDLGPGVTRRWLQIVLRVIGGTALACIFIVVGMGILLNAGMKTQYRTVTSPSGSHHATLAYTAGFLGRDFSVITVTKNGCCQHFAAYRYDGPSDLQDTTIVWLDDTHLRIEYRADVDRYQQCKSQVADVTIICAPLGAGKN